MHCIQLSDLSSHLPLVEDSRDVCSNTELSDLYSHSPVKKKLRHTEVDDDLQRFMLAAQTGGCHLTVSV